MAASGTASLVFIDDVTTDRRKGMGYIHCSDWAKCWKTGQTGFRVKSVDEPKQTTKETQEIFKAENWRQKQYAATGGECSKGLKEHLEPSTSGVTDCKRFSFTFYKQFILDRSIMYELLKIRDWASTKHVCLNQGCRNIRPWRGARNSLAKSPNWCCAKNWFAGL